MLYREAGFDRLLAGSLQCSIEEEVLIGFSHSNWFAGDIFYYVFNYGLINVLRSDV